MKNLAPYKPTAYELKYIVCRYLLYRRNYKYAFTEWMNEGDVIGLTKAMYPTEVEIKVSMSDLKSELKAMQGERGNNSWNKVHKHKMYLEPETERYHWNRPPKYFYLCVPDYLEEIAMAGVQDLPYGVLVARFNETASLQEYDMWWKIEELKPAQTLGGDRVKPVELQDCLNKAMNELLNYRRKLAMLASETTQELL